MLIAKRRALETEFAMLCQDVREALTAIPGTRPTP